MDIWNYINPIAVDTLSRHFLGSGPIRHFAIDDFLRPEFLEQIQSAYPSYAEAMEFGHEFHAVNESRKVQVTDPARFPAPVRILSQVIATPAFREVLARITEIQALRFDDEFAGGGMHIMAPGGRLDVHVDFNILRERNLYRRLNILLFTTREWREEWGGRFELWDPEVKNCFFSAAPLPNRLLAFNTTETSFHGVTPVRSPPGINRTSFASYYYTREATASLAGRFHSTVWRARPDEWWRRSVMMPAERSALAVREALRSAKRTLLHRPRRD